jgi:hypothetical protein
MELSRRLDAASTTWNDYLGTAAADDVDALTGRRSLYELAGLDRDRWVVVAVDLAVRAAEPEVVVYAVDRSADQEAAFDIDAVIAANGYVPVTAVRLSVQDQVEAFLNDAFRRLAVRLVARGFREETLVVKNELTASGSI